MELSEDEKKDIDDFDTWWDNEGSRPFSNIEEKKYDFSELIKIRAIEAWTNGAWKARERNAYRNHMINMKKGFE